MEKASGTKPSPRPASDTANTPSAAAQPSTALIALADNETLSMTHSILSKRMRSLRYSGNSGAENWAAAMAEHDAMIAALERRDGPALAKAMREHIQNTWPRIRGATQSTPG